MKNTFILLVVIYLSGQICAQNQADSITNIEKFMKNKNIFMKKEFIKTGSFKECDLEIIKCSNVETAITISGFSIIFKYKNKVNYLTTTKIGYLDKSDLERLINYLEYIKKNVVNTSPTVYTEYIYKNAGNFKAGCLYSSRTNFKKEYWKFFIQLKDYDEDSTIYFSESELAPFIDALKTAVAIL